MIVWLIECDPVQVADWDELLHDRLRYPPPETEFRCPGEQHQIHYDILEQRAKHILMFLTESY